MTRLLRVLLAVGCLFFGTSRAEAYFWTVPIAYYPYQFIAVAYNVQDWYWCGDDVADIEIWGSDGYYSHFEDWFGEGAVTDWYQHTAWYAPPTFSMYAWVDNCHGEGFSDRWEQTATLAIWGLSADARAWMSQEYIDWGVYDYAYWNLGELGNGPYFLPIWWDYTTNVSWGGPGSLNDGYWPWAIVRNNYLYGRVPAMQDAFIQRGGEPIRVSSAYRNPAANFSVGGAILSRHMWGDAVDVKPAGMGAGNMDENEWWELYAAAWDTGASYVEPLAQSTLNHVHADYRTWP